MNGLKKILCAVLAGLLVLSLNVAIPSTNVFADENATAEWDTWSDTWALTDALGRTAADYSTVGGINGNKQVGIFYSVWQSSLMAATYRTDKDAPRNLTKIIEENPDTWLTDAGLYGPGASMHYWGEPLYGYYDLSKDDWVIRAHASLLAEAGVDYIMCDMTNFYSSGRYREEESNIETLKNICKVFRQMREEGQKTPCMTILFTWNPMNCGQAINWMYENLIKDNLDVWYYTDGKPLLFGSGNYVDSSIKDLFSYRSVAANYDAINSYQWLSIYPQSYVKNENGSAAVMTVSVAQNWTDGLAAFTHVNEYGQFIACGRSWTSESSRLLTNPTDKEYHSEYGYNFQEQFNRALDIDPDMLIVTGWNEWIAARFYETLYKNVAGDGLPNYANFVDGFTTEFSRDIEMTKEGELKDNFYNQLVENIRLFKGVRPAPDYTQKKTISFKNGMADWKSVSSYYRDTLNDNVMRDADGVAGLHYTNYTGRNDFVQCKMARDNERVYFYAECADKITGAYDGSWMRLYIKTTGVGGWEGYNYVINKDTPVLGKSTVYRFNGSWVNITKVGSADVITEDNKIAVAVKLADLGLSADNVKFEFKWHDNAQVDGDAMEFYLSGDCAPDARFNYVYTEATNSSDLPRGASINDAGSEYSTMSMIETDVAAFRFKAKSEFKGIELTAFTSDNKAGTSYTVKLYRFDKDYAKTLSSAPLTCVTYNSVYDGSSLYTGAKKISAGEYLVTVSNISKQGDNVAGLYYCRGQEKNGGLYLNGKYSSEMGLKCKIYYTGTKAYETSLTKDGNAYFIKLNEPQSVLGISLTAKGSSLGNFALYISTDGQNYSLFNNHDYANYSATNASQVFLGDGEEISSVKIVCDGEIESVSLLTPATAKEQPQEQSGCRSSVSSGIGAAVLAICAFVVLKKKGGF